MAGPIRIWSVLDDNGKDVGSDECANLAHGGSDAVILATNGGSGRFGGNQPNIVAWAGLAEREKDATEGMCQ